MRTSEQITAEIEANFGFVPPFFSPALQTPAVLDNLWQQTLSAYVNNPLSLLFKEKLSAYLSRYCAVPYCMICHSCNLRPLGMKAQEVLELLESPLPKETDIDEHLRRLAAQPNGLKVWPESNSLLEESLLYCSIFIATEHDSSEDCRQELRRILEPSTYAHLVTFIAYVKMCHVWMEAHPEVVYAADKRVKDNLDALLEEEPGFTDFFHNYTEKVRQEQKSWGQQQAQIVERKQTEEKLIRVTQAVESTSDAISMTDMSGSSIYHNQAFVNLYGYTVDELNAAGGLRAMYVRSEIAEQVFEAIQNGRSWSGEIENKTKSGRIVPTLLRADCIVDDSGNRIGLIEVCTDITSRQEAENARRQQTERERLLVEIAQRIRESLNLEEILNTTVSEVRQFLQVDRVFIYRFQSDWGGVVVVESVNSGWKPIIGSTLRDSTFAESYVQPYKKGRIQATADIYAAGLTPCYIDFLAQFQVRADLVVPVLQGEQLWGLLVANHCSKPREWHQLEIDLLKQLATQLAIAIQQSTLFQQVKTELVERQRAEQKIREQAALLDITTDAILVQDLKDQILFWNKGAERLYGWKAHEAFGKNANLLLYREISPELEAAVKTVAEKGKWQGELNKVQKDGKEIIVESRWTLVLDRLEKPKSILIVDTDITEKKQFEAQFFRAQRMESIGTLASGIAHDLNNVLAPILMSAQLLQMKMSDERSQRLLKILENNVKRGAALVKQVLSFSRGLEGKRTILQVRHLILEIKNIANETFPKSIEFYIDIAPDLWSVCGDATQLHQVLMNLCVNARDAMPNGGTLSISGENIFIDENYARMHLDAVVGNYIIITVADTGTGISPEILDRIFEPFFTTKDLGLGTGLGLATVMGIIKSHGGFINVYSQVGLGTQFKVFLPAAEGTETQQLEDLELPIGNGQLILVVDDEAAICEIAQTSLETFRYKVLTASDGIEALALYAQHKAEISVVLMDMMMPSMDGPTTIRTLQKINPKVKIIAVSGLASSDKVTAAMGSGVKAFLSKPYTAQELLKTIDKVLNTT